MDTRHMVGCGALHNISACTCEVLIAAKANLRRFVTGATRSPEAGRDDPEGFLSPLAIDRFNEYMTQHRVQADGTIRDSDNWQKGLPLATYMKGLLRHVLHLWTRHRGFPVRDPKAGKDIEEDLCAAWFNIQGYLHEVLKAKLAPPSTTVDPQDTLDASHDARLAATPPVPAGEQRVPNGGPTVYHHGQQI